MPSAKAFYKPEESVFCNDGRETNLLKFVESHERFEQMKNNPHEVLAAIDEYGHLHDFLMNVGQEKGRIVSQIIAENKPAFMVELGGYVGYSAIMFGNALRAAGGKKFLSLELNPDFAKVASSLIALAGLDDVVEIIVGPCSASLRRLQHIIPGGQIDLLFLDHQKSAYINDLLLSEELGLVREGSLVVADNIISPGAPLYLEFVRGTPEEKAAIKKQMTPGSDGYLPSGNPALAYDTKLINSFEPTGEPDGLEVSLCITSKA